LVVVGSDGHAKKASPMVGAVKGLGIDALDCHVEATRP